MTNKLAGFSPNSEMYLSVGECPWRKSAREREGERASSEMQMNKGGEEKGFGRTCKEFGGGGWRE